MIYVLRSPHNGLLKIGWTSHEPSLRLDRIRGMSPVPVDPVAVLPGRVVDELALHARFASAREHGEWFRPEPGLLAWVASDAIPWDGGPVVPRPLPVHLPPIKQTADSEWVEFARVFAAGFPLT